MDPLGVEQLPKIAADAIDRLHAAGDEMIDRAINQEASTLADRAASQFSNIVHGALTSLADIESKTSLDIQAIIASLDGWTITPEGPLGAITGPIRLNKPKP